MGGACSTHGDIRYSYQTLFGSVSREDDLGDKIVERKKMLNESLINMACACGLNSNCSGGAQ